ncbi:hypothetical protein [Amycolatopsis thailandensis]|uniref:hypothetical protein n=1 Tax=Amycolatopsis thailandensis TaxID=589330 RepID=UPI003634F02A
MFVNLVNAGRTAVEAFARESSLLALTAIRTETIEGFFERELLGVFPGFPAAMAV